jgi:HEAT repeat protein
MAERIDPLIQKLVEKLHDQDPITRRNAAGALRLNGARAAAAAKELSKLLADEDPRVRAEAHRALDRLRSTAA